MEIVSGSGPIDEVNRLRQGIEEQIDMLKNIDDEGSPQLKSVVVENLQSILDGKYPSDSGSFSCSMDNSCEKFEGLTSDEMQQKSDEQQEAEEEGPEEEALRLPTVMNVLLEYFSFEEIKKLRFVGPRWNDNISTYMLGKDFCIIKFDYDEDLREYEFDSKYRQDSKYHEKSFEELLDPLCGSKNFPCSSFSFDKGDFDCPEADMFWSVHGQKIRTLRIAGDPTFPRINRETLINILTKLAPNVERLELGQFGYMKWDEENRLNLPFLKSLTCVDWNKQTCTPLDMLDKAPKLQEVYNFHPLYIDWFVQEKKVHTIKKFAFEFPLVEQFRSMMKKFAEANPQLQHLTIQSLLQISSADSEGKSELATILNSLLESSKKSLRVLEMVSLNSLPDVRLPKLENLQTLKLLCAAVGDFYTMFPKEIILDEAFPNVETVVIDLAAVEDLVEEYFPQESFSGSLTTVKCLELYNGCRPTDQFYQRLHSMMPNVTRLVQSVGFGCQTIDLLLIHAHFPDLEEIEFKCSIHAALTDSAFTGIAEMMCLRLRFNGQEITKDLVGELKQRSIAIYDFQNLKSLKISIVNKNYGADVYYKIKMPSDITGYAFQRKEDLQVTIAYHQHCKSSPAYTNAFSDIAPFVKVIHEDVIIMNE